MSAAGHDRLLRRSASWIVGKETKGFHLVRIDGYSQIKTIPPGRKVSSTCFELGGRSWRVDYYPNGRDASANHNAISVYLQLVAQTYRPTEQHAQARYKFSLLDHGGNTAYELPFENGSFVSVTVDYKEQVPGCGHEAFIGKEDLERLELIRDDTILLRCDLGVTEIGTSWLAQDDVDPREHGEEDYEDEDPEEEYGAPPPRRRFRRADDNEYAKWCLAERPTSPLFDY